MNYMPFRLLRNPLVFLAELLIAAACYAQLPAGTLLPTMLNTTLNSNSDKPGKHISAQIKQDVPLPDRGRIKAGSEITGHIISVSRGAGGAAARIVMAFDTLDAGGRTLHIATELRALASMQAVYEARQPANQSGYDSNVWNWNVRQVGGEVAFGGRQVVLDAAEQVVASMPSPGVVIGKARPNPERGCTAAVDNALEQALWVFSTDACGVYGFENVKLERPEASQPRDQITLVAPNKVLVRGGSGLLLAVLPEKSAGK